MPSGGDGQRHDGREVKRAGHRERPIVDTRDDAFARADGAERAARWSDALLLVPRPAGIATKVLVCATRGEPGKESIRFTGRLVRHLGSEATVLTIVSEGEGAGEERVLAEARGRKVARPASFSWSQRTPDVLMV